MRFDALHTPPSASLAAMLSHSDAQAQRPPQSPTTRTESTLHSSANDDLSSSDKENSPSYASQKLNRASSKDSAVMTTLLVSSPVKQNMSFTPQRIRPLPRAWERRPATPYVPRSEGQKIWKRVPLQELGVEGNQMMPRREQEGKTNYVRVIKRLRLDNKHGVASMEEHSNWTTSAVGTKWVEENIEKGGSPKKKTRTDSAVFNELLKAPVDSENESSHVLSVLVDDDLGGLRDTDEPGDDSPVLTFDKIMQPHDTETNVKDITTAIDDNIASTAPMKEISEDAESSTPTIGGSSEDSATCTRDSPTEAGVVPIGPVHDDKNVAAMEDLVRELVVQTVPEVGTDADAGYESSPVFDQHRSLASGSMSEESDSTTNSQIFKQKTSTEDGFVCSVVSRPSSIFLTTENDETAFLRDFLERAHASKAARVVLSPRKRSEPAPFETESKQLHPENIELREMEVTDTIEDDDLSPPAEDIASERTVSRTDIKATSPTRRSARTASRASSSRLPRFQMPSTSHSGPLAPSPSMNPLLPPTIQLKRATGSEFIFNAKSQQTLAMATRSNTKKNQGDAIHVAQRLAQLKKELEVRQQAQNTTETAGSQTIGTIVEFPVQADEDVGIAVKKRKRERQDDGKPSRVKRNVQWPSDDVLAQYREPTPLPDNLDDRSISEEVMPLMLPVTSDISLGSTPDILNSVETRCEVAKSESRPKRDDSPDDLSKLKVRRIRKIKLDSVNGTPAPKTRSRTTELELVGSSATLRDDNSAVTSKTRKSSRMPVPVSTPIPLPSLTSTKSKTQAAGQEKAKSKAVVAPVKSLTEGSTAPRHKIDGTSTDHSNLDRKLDGRRRLRDRS